MITTIEEAVQAFRDGKVVFYRCNEYVSVLSNLGQCKYGFLRVGKLYKPPTFIFHHPENCIRKAIETHRHQMEREVFVTDYMSNLFKYETQS
jgi:hypothetical protein